MDPKTTSAPDIGMGNHLIGLRHIHLPTATLMHTDLQRPLNDTQVERIKAAILRIGITAGDELHAILDSEECELEVLDSKSGPIQNLKVIMIAGQHRATAVQRACQAGFNTDAAVWACYLYRPSLKELGHKLKGWMWVRNYEDSDKTAPGLKLSEHELLAEFLGHDNIQEAGAFGSMAGGASVSLRRLMDGLANDQVSFMAVKKFRSQQSEVFQRLSIGTFRELFPMHGFSMLFAVLVDEVLEWWSQYVDMDERTRKAILVCTKKAPFEATLGGRSKVTWSDTMARVNPTAVAPFYGLVLDEGQWSFNILPNHTYFTTQLKANLQDARNVKSLVRSMLGFSPVDLRTKHTEQHLEFQKMCFRCRSYLPAEVPTEEADRDNFLKHNPLFFTVLEACDEEETPERVKAVEQRIAAMKDAEKQEAQRVTSSGLLSSTEDAYGPMIMVEWGPGPQTQQSPVEDPVATTTDTAPTEEDAIPMQENDALLNQPPAISHEAAQNVPDREGDMEGAVPSDTQSKTLPYSPIIMALPEPAPSPKSSDDALANKQKQSAPQGHEPNAENSESGCDSDEESGSTTSDSALDLTKRHAQTAEDLKKWWWSKGAQVDDDDNDGDDDDNVTRSERSGDDGDDSSDGNTTTTTTSSFNPPSRSSKAGPSSLLTGLRSRQPEEGLPLWDDSSREQALLAQRVWRLMVAIPKDDRLEKLHRCISVLKDVAPSPEPLSEDPIDAPILEHRKRKRAVDSDSDSVAITRSKTVVPFDLSDDNLVALRAKVESTQSIFLLGAGASVEAGLPTFRDDNGNPLPEFAECMQWGNFAQNVNDARKQIWVFALQVLTARSNQRGPTHTLANFAIRNQLIKGIVTTNVDGLETMEDLLLATDVPHYATLFSSPPAPWIGSNDTRVAHIHGDICIVACNSCWTRRTLTPEFGQQLIEGTQERCAECDLKRSPNLSFWRPDIFFYNDPRQELNVEHHDDTWSSRGSKKSSKKRRTVSMAVSNDPQRATDLESYHSIMATSQSSSVPKYMFIIGSSLLNKRLSRDITSLSNRGTEMIWVNPQRPIIAKELQGVVIWIQSQAKVFSRKMLLALGS